jgi:hypothetical protein
MILGFLMEELIPSFCHLESLRESIEMRFVALDEASLGTHIYGDSQQALGLVYLLRSFHC